MSVIINNYKGEKRGAKKNKRKGRRKEGGIEEEIMQGVII